MVYITGCGKVTMENYDKINTGMTLAEVESILGKGEAESGGGVAVGDLALSGKAIMWGNDTKHIKITFANDKVTMKVQKGL